MQTWTSAQVSASARVLVPQRQGGTTHLASGLQELHSAISGKHYHYSKCRLDGGSRYGYHCIRMIRVVSMFSFST